MAEIAKFNVAMAKRMATTELNHDNWDDDDVVVEEAGTFKCASEEEIGRRVVKKAKRRLNDGTPTNTAFAGFKGFGTATASATKPAFSFAGQKNLFESISNGHDDKKTDATSKTFERRDVAFSIDPPPSIAAATTPSSDSLKSVKPVTNDRTEFYHQLRCLNEGLLSWIKQHIDKNPYCILSPVFSDYDRHVKDLEAKYETDAKTEQKQEKKVESEVKSAEEGSKTKWPSFTENAKMATRLLDTKAETENVTVDDEDGEYVPPKNDVLEVNEEDAFYKKKCKLFYKKDSSFKDKGVGTLYLKRNNDKVQLVIRADTSLGNILLNINLTQSVPTARVGKNNVNLVCTPNPPLDQKSDPREPVTFLVRVKTTEDADELLSVMNENKT